MMVILTAEHQPQHRSGSFILEGLIPFHSDRYVNICTEITKATVRTKVIVSKGESLER